MKWGTLFLLLCACLGLTAVAAESEPGAPSSGGDLQQLAGDADKATHAAQQSLLTAKSSISLYLQAAQAHCRETMAGNPDYGSASAALLIAKKELAEARNARDSQREVAASSHVNRLTERLKQFEDDAFAADPDVQSANKMLADLMQTIQPTPSQHSTVAGIASGKQKPAVPHKRYDKIEIGMTKDELNSFLRWNHRLKIVGDTVQQTADGSAEEIHIDIMQPREVAVGSHQDVLGGWHQDTAVQYFTVGRISVVLTNGAVSQLDGNASSY